MACTFPHLNFQKWPEVSCALWLFSLANALCATTASALASQLPKMLHTWCVSCILIRATTAFSFSSFIWPDCWRPPLWRVYCLTLQSHKSLEKHGVSRLFYLFTHLHLLSFDSFSSLILSLLRVSSVLLLFPLLRFPVHIVGFLTSKLPSNMQHIHNI